MMLEIPSDFKMGFWDHLSCHLFRINTILETGMAG